MTRYEQLKKVIQEANSEIMELKLGCEIETDEGGKGTITYCFENHPFLFSFHWIDVEGDRRVAYNIVKRNNTILGRPIRLADVLLAIPDRAGEQISCNQNGVFMKGKECLWAKWNCLNDNLEYQSDECKQFLIQLLTPNQDEKQN